MKRLSNAALRKLLRESSRFGISRSPPDEIEGLLFDDGYDSCTAALFAQAPSLVHEVLALRKVAMRASKARGHVSCARRRIALCEALAAYTRQTRGE